MVIRFTRLLLNYLYNMNAVQDILRRLKPQAQDLNVKNNFKGEHWRREFWEENLYTQKGAMS